MEEDDALSYFFQLKLNRNTFKAMGRGGGSYF